MSTRVLRPLHPFACSSFLFHSSVLKCNNVTLEDLPELMYLHRMIFPELRFEGKFFEGLMAGSIKGCTLARPIVSLLTPPVLLFFVFLELLLFLVLLVRVVIPVSAISIIIWGWWWIPWGRALIVVSLSL